MLLELIATVFAGFFAAGIALILRKLSAQKLPRWLIPAFAGAGMLGFQIYSEYHWYSHQASRLPEGVIVVSEVTQSNPWRPWSYVVPQVVRFIAADVGNARPNSQYPQLVLVDLYLFERRHLAQQVPQVIDCESRARADLTADLMPPIPNAAIRSPWFALATDDRLLKVCGHGYQ